MASGKLLVKAGANGPVILPALIQGVGVIGDEPMEVDDTRFIRRRLDVGDLVLAPVAPMRAASKPSKEKE